MEQVDTDLKPHSRVKRQRISVPPITITTPANDTLFNSLMLSFVGPKSRFALDGHYHRRTRFIQFLISGAR